MSDNEITIQTNHHERDVLHWHDLTETERAWFDYLDTPIAQQDAHFVRYKGACYDLGEFMRTPTPGKDTPNTPTARALSAWQGYMSESYFSGVLIRFVDGCDGERVIVGTYFS